MATVYENDLAKWRQRADGSQTIDDAIFFCRAWITHRAAMARCTYSDPQRHLEICVPFGGPDMTTRGDALAEAKREILRAAKCLGLMDGPRAGPDGRAISNLKVS